MKFSTWELRRREFLKALGVGAGMMPLLTETRVAGAPATRARFFVMAKGNGCRAVDFWPTWPNNVRPADGSLDTAVLPYCTTNLTPYKKYLLFPDGLALRNWLKSEGNPTGDNGNAHHDWGSMLTGELPSERLLTAGGCNLNVQPPGCRMLAGSASIDCYLGGEFQKQDATLRFASVNAGVLGSPAANGYATASWFGKEKPNARENNPMKLFDAIFAGAAQPGGAPDADANRSARERLRLLDFVGKDIQRFGRRMGQEDRLALDAHLDTVNMRSKQLQTLLDHPLACTRPASPMALALTEPNTEKLSHVMLDMLVDAMKCGVTRAACYTLFDSNAYDCFFTWLKDINPNFSSDKNPALKVSEFPQLHFHSMTHGSSKEPGTTMYKDGNRWHVDQAVYLLQRLSTEPEGTGTMLDNTLVLYADSLSMGGAHTVYRMPWFLAGNVGNYFKTGRHVMVGNNVASNGLFVSIASAFGVPSAGGVFGNPRFGMGEMPGLR